MTLLQHHAYQVLHIESTEHGYHIIAETVAPNRACPHCQSIDTIGFGRREQRLRDNPIHGKQVVICVDTRRYRCRFCNRTFFERLPEIDTHHAMTNRLVKWIGQQSLKHTFTDVAQTVGVTEGTVRLIFKNFITNLEASFRFAMPQWIGIHTVHLIKPRCFIANLRHNTLVNLLPDCDKKTVIHYLSCLPRKEEVQYVAMDMWLPYREAVQAVLPNAQIVIDRFHVITIADKALETVRKRLRKQLTPKQQRNLAHDRLLLFKHESDLTDQDRLLMDSWTKNYPALVQAYQLKEGLYRIYEKQRQIQSVMGSYKAWVALLSTAAPEVQDAFSDLIHAWADWQSWILAYFEHPISSLYIESLNQLIHVIGQLGRGYSFEALRAKLLFSQDIPIGLQDTGKASAPLIRGAYVDIGEQRSQEDNRTPGDHTVQPLKSDGYVCEPIKETSTYPPSKEACSPVRYVISSKKPMTLVSDLKVAESHGEYKTETNYGIRMSTLVGKIKNGTL